MNDLLLWMSARGEGSLAAWRAKIAEVMPGRPGATTRHRVAEWHFSQLAHAEFGEAADNGWRICPPVLAASDPGDAPLAVLCGARTPHVLDALLSAAAGMVAFEPQREGPDTVTVATSEPAKLLAISRISGIPVQWNASLAILGAAGSPHAIQLQAAPVPIGGWTVTRFSKTGLGWVPSSVQEAQGASSGLFRFRSDIGSTCILKEGDESFAIDPSEGKYRIMMRRHRPLQYDFVKKELSVAIACRPPPLFQRALVVCSGRLPEVRDGRIIYTSVGRYVAEAVATVLRQRLY